MAKGTPWTRDRRLAAIRVGFGYDADTGVVTRLYTGATGTLGKRGYIVFGVGNRLVYAHLIAWFLAKGAWPAMSVDHINCVKTDNRLDNLRLASQSQNLGNSRKHRDNMSGIKGVYWDKSRGQWMARIRTQYLGRFDSPLEAQKAYAAAAIRIYGEFARTD